MLLTRDGFGWYANDDAAGVPADDAAREPWSPAIASVLDAIEDAYSEANVYRRWAGRDASSGYTVAEAHGYRDDCRSCGKTFGWCSHTNRRANVG